MGRIGDGSLKFRVQIFPIAEKRTRSGSVSQGPDTTPLPGPSEPLEGEDPTYWPASYRRWSSSENPGKLDELNLTIEIGSFGFSENPNITVGMFLNRIDPESGEQRMFSAISASENSSGVGFRWYVNVQRYTS